MDLVKPKARRLFLLVVLLICSIVYLFYSTSRSDNPIKLSPNYSDDFDSVRLNAGGKFSGHIISHTETGLVLKPIVVGQLDVVYPFEYSDIQDIKLAKSSSNSVLQAKLSGSDIEKEEFQEAIKKHYQYGELDRLQKIYQRILKDKDRFSSSEWKLDVFYRALERRHQDHTLTELEEYTEGLKQWRQDKPNFILPLTLLIRANTDLAWKHRGGGFNNKVFKKGWDEFQKKLDTAKALIESIDKRVVLDPEFHRARISVAVGLGNLRRELIDILNKVDRYDKNYYKPYVVAAPFLLPRWVGTKGVVESYADWLTLKDEGNKIYARVAVHVKNYTDESNYKKLNFDWVKIKNGFNLIAKSYEISLREQHAYIWMACYYQDYDMVKRLSDQVGLVWNQEIKKIWDSFSDYYNCKRLANLENRPIDLFKEVRTGNLQNFSELIKNNKNIDINIQNKYGETPLFYAIRAQYFDFAKLLIDNNASPHLSNNRTTQPIHKAAELGANEILSILLEKGINVNEQDKRWRETPLHYAVKNHRSRVVQQLLKTKSIDVNLKNGVGETALHLAVELGRVDTVIRLVDVIGINVNVIDSYQNTPLNIALDNDYKDIALLLKAKGAKSSDKAILSKEREIASTLFKKAQRLQEKGDNTAAKKLYLQSLEVNPYLPGTYSNLALIDMFEHNFEGCLENTAKAIDISITYSHAIYSAAQCSFMLHQPKKVYLDYYRRYIEINPNTFRTKELFQKHPELK